MFRRNATRHHDRRRRTRPTVGTQSDEGRDQPPHRPHDRRGCSHTDRSTAAPARRLPPGPLPTRPCSPCALLRVPPHTFVLIWPCYQTLHKRKRRGSLGRTPCSTSFRRTRARRRPRSSARPRFLRPFRLQSPSHNPLVFHSLLLLPHHQLLCPPQHFRPRVSLLLLVSLGWSQSRCRPPLHPHPHRRRLSSQRQSPLQPQPPPHLLTPPAQPTRPRRPQALVLRSTSDGPARRSSARPRSSQTTTTSTGSQAQWARTRRCSRYAGIISCTLIQSHAV